MYHSIVKRKLRKAFADINAGRYERIVPQFAATHRHVFYGEHALGGARTHLAATRRWYERLARVFPDLRFDLRTVAVGGWPWNTVAMIEWTDRFSVNGVPSSNQGVHVFRLRWGRVVELAIYCDTDRLGRYLQQRADGGCAEAVGQPIVG